MTARLRRELYDISNLNEGDDILGNDDRRRVLREGDRLWHTDRSFIPADTTYSLLSAREVPPEGGNTEFADMRAAYDALPEAVKFRSKASVASIRSGIRACWRGPSRKTSAPTRRAAMPGTMQPLVRTHARTGRKSLVLASHVERVVGLSDEQGRALIDQLTKFAIQDRFVYSHRWSVGELVIWDNRCTMHRGRPSTTHATAATCAARRCRPQKVAADVEHRGFNAVVIARSEATKQSSGSTTGLLRFARNDE